MSRISNWNADTDPSELKNRIRIRIETNADPEHLLAELDTRSFSLGSLSAPHSIFSPGSLTLTRSFFEFPFSLVAQTLVAQPVVR
jgi:hypothetical protein